MKLKLLGTTLFFAVAALVTPAQAEIEEVRVGVVGNIRSDHGDSVEGKEEGANIEMEFVSNSPDFINLIGSPCS